jgi:hypothetical protein
MLCGPRKKHILPSGNQVGCSVIKWRKKISGAVSSTTRQQATLWWRVFFLQGCDSGRVRFLYVTRAFLLELHVSCVTGNIVSRLSFLDRPHDHPLGHRE